jgi:hypothetical protein
MCKAHLNQSCHPCCAGTWIGGSQSRLPGHKREVLSGKCIKEKELGAWLKWQNACLASARSQYQQNKTKMQGPIWKVIKAKRVVDVVQVEKCLSSNHKALSSNPSTGGEKPKTPPWALTLKQMFPWDHFPAIKHYLWPFKKNRRWHQKIHNGVGQGGAVIPAFGGSSHNLRTTWAVTKLHLKNKRAGSVAQVI